MKYFSNYHKKLLFSGYVYLTNRILSIKKMNRF